MEKIKTEDELSYYSMTKLRKRDRSMKQWERALHVFLEEWKNREDVIGAIVCGSYVTGDPSPHSDIDVHLILSDEVNWRKRGNVVVDRYLIEYFANPPKQIKKYFEEDHKNGRPHSMVQFLTGRTVFDKFGEIEILKDEAKVWFNKEYKELKNSPLELTKYHLWDTLDNLTDCYEQDRTDFDFVYYNALRVLFEEYSNYLRTEIIPIDQIFRFISDPHFLEKYLANPFPDQHFSDQFLQCLTEHEKAAKIKMFDELTQYVLDKMGGFNIDGWEIKSAVE